MKNYFQRVDIPAFISLLLLSYAGRALKDYAATNGSDNGMTSMLFLIFAAVLVALPRFVSFRAAFRILAGSYLALLTVMFGIDPNGVLFSFMATNAPAFFLVMLWGWIAQHTTMQEGLKFYFPFVIVYLLFTLGLYDMALPTDAPFWGILAFAVGGFLPLVINEPSESGTGKSFLSPLILVVFLSLATVLVSLGTDAADAAVRFYYPGREFGIFTRIFTPYAQMAVLVLFPVVGLIAYGFVRTLGWKVVTMATLIIFGVTGAILFFVPRLGAIVSASIGVCFSFIESTLFFPLIQLLILHVSLKWRFTTQVIFGWLMVPWLSYLLAEAFVFTTQPLGDLAYFSGVLLVGVSALSLAAVYFYKTKVRG